MKLENNKKENKYLVEDQDLLDELDKIKPIMSGEDNQIKMNALEIRSTFRNRKTMSDMDKSTSRFSLILVVFAMVQIVIALSQFIFDAVTSNHKYIAAGLAVFMIIAIWFIFNAFDPDKIIKK